MHPKRLSQLCVTGFVVTLVALLHEFLVPGQKLDGPQAGGLEETILDKGTFTRPTTLQLGRFWSDQQPAPQRSLAASFSPGVSDPTANYSSVVVIPKMQEDDVSWIAEELPWLNFTIYIANDPTTSMHPPKNKGHEVMIYLSYLIDNYERLPDIVIFMHSHRWTHHNNNLLGFDASQMIHSLNNAHIIRQGYVNMRCQWSPGCPEWLRPSGVHDTLSRQEERVLERCWKELFPFDPLPLFLAQPCCAQFALSRDRIVSIPQSRYIYYRDWILRTPLSDYISGRIWEYSWQFLFTGNAMHCPFEHVCYCDGFGICFGGETLYHDYLQLSRQRDNLEAELRRQNRTYFIDSNNGSVSGISDEQYTAIHAQRWTQLNTQFEELEKELNGRRNQAQQRGADPRLRAEECGRPWKEGDSF
ncbi:MAG: hypothetical protein LQ352_005847 [Teloschistes flavicans]|nr:MAG: hypothetical protein LQ352_005847 [Teloschistes flavicans]